ncbi:MAG: cell wall hydrolase [Pseudomonadota bacterium]
MTNQTRQAIYVRTAMGAACASALIVTLPAIDAAHEDQREDAQLRTEINAFASYQDGGAAARALDGAPNLLQHPWLVRMEGNLENRAMAALTQASAHDRDMLALATMARFESRQMDKAETLAAEAQCMAEAVYYEARSESLSGQLAVAEVVANRVTDHRYPNSVCDVVYQGATRTTGCQFTFTCDGALAKKPVGKRWDQAQHVAAQVLMGLHEPRTGKATHYHATYVDPVWNSGLMKTEKIGTHIFYRFPRGTEWAVARERLDRRMASRNRGGIVTVAAPAPAPKPAAPATVVSAYADAQILKASGPVAAAMPARAAASTADLNAVSLQTVASPAAP